MIRTPSAPNNDLAASQRNGMSAKGKTVLLVEDNEDNRIVYSTILRHFGYSVTEALNGEEGIAKARSEKPDLILMDISIPGIDGWTATERIRQDDRTANIPVVAVTAFGLTTSFNYAMSGLVNWPLAAVFILGGVAGSAIGTRAARVLSADKGRLNMIFAGFVMLVAVYMLWKSWAELAG